MELVTLLEIFIALLFTFMSVFGFYFYDIINYTKNLINKYNKLVDDYNLLIKENKKNIEDYNSVINEINEKYVFPHNKLTDKYNDLLIETKFIYEEPREKHLNFLLEKVSLLGEESLTEKQKLYLKKFI